MNKQGVGILCVPFDYGIKLSNGRPGARFAPKEIKKEFLKLIRKNKKCLSNVQIIDYGKIAPIEKNVKKTHEKITRKVKTILHKGVLSVVIGGGHDISFGSGKAMSLVYKKVGGVNIDAHYDVRPVVNGKISSGTPFRRLLDKKYIKGKNFVEIGVHSPKNLKEHRTYLIKKKAVLINLSYLNKIGVEKSLQRALLIAGKKTAGIMFDVDIDGIQSRFAPGCSAPGVKGFTKKQVLKAAYLAGKNKNVKLFNLMEVSPVHDINNKTVKLAALLILEFIKGVNKR